MGNTYTEERKEAIRWWENLNIGEMLKYTNLYYKEVDPVSLTARQIHNIYINVHELAD